MTAPSAVPTVHVSALSATAAVKKSGWIATVTVSTADAYGTPISGATVTGTWSTGVSAGCTTTGSTASCSFITTMNKKTASATYTVGGVSANGYTYDATANVRSSVTVTAPK